MKKKLFLPIVVIAMVVLFASNVHARLSRLFPPPPSNSKLGELTAINYPKIEINGDTLQLGAGGQIRGTNNLIILPALLTEFGPILYWIGPTGDVQRIWLLTPEEAAQAEEEGKYETE
ncbi:MAG: hypothetical protein E4H07_09750 [Nitrosomonadales bacterium]|jgi:hypothetical protein|nr:MAG: hypothetical protein E4H07_09750 [Nitrosomonadales bacterium]